MKKLILAVLMVLCLVGVGFTEDLTEEDVVDLQRQRAVSARAVGGLYVDTISTNNRDLYPLKDTKWLFTYTISGTTYKQTITMGPETGALDDGGVSIKATNQDGLYGWAFPVSFTNRSRGFYMGLREKVGEPGSILFYFNVNGSAATGVCERYNSDTDIRSQHYDLIGIDISNTSDCDLAAARKEGQQQCIDDPASCGITTGYTEAELFAEYQKGKTACQDDPASCGIAVNDCPQEELDSEYQRGKSVGFNDGIAFGKSICTSNPEGCGIEPLACEGCEESAFVDDDDCLAFGENLSLEIPCAAAGDAKYGFKLLRTSPFSTTWEIDMDSVTEK